MIEKVAKVVDTAKIKVIEIHKDKVMDLAGEPWAACLSLIDTGKTAAKVVEITVGTITKARPTTSPEALASMPYLAIDHVWLREVDKRAFLYLCNY